MKFDGKELFGKGEQTLQVQSWRREGVDYGFAGLDGVVSVDLGRRERKLKQQGWLTAESVGALMRQMEEISGYIDGQGYELVDGGGIGYRRVRMDSFALLGSITAGNQARCEYEINYTQLS